MASMSNVPDTTGDIMSVGSRHKRFLGDLLKIQ